MEDIQAKSALEEQTIQRISKRIIPFLIILFVMAFLDRTHIGFAAVQMHDAIGITQTIFGLGAGIFFLGYFIAEVPSNVLLHRFGARIWIARIMITWGIIAALMGFIQNGTQFIVLRFLLGIAEAGFFPGVIFYLTLWFPARYRARVFATFYLGLPIAQIIGAPISVGLMQWGDTIGYEGWRLMYVLEGIPSIILGIICLKYLTNTPKEAQWLTTDQRQWLMNTLEKILGNNFIEFSFELEEEINYPSLLNKIEILTDNQVSIIYNSYDYNSQTLSFNVLDETYSIRAPLFYLSSELIDVLNKIIKNKIPYLIQQLRVVVPVWHKDAI